MQDWKQRMTWSYESQTASVTVQSAIEGQITFILGHPQISLWLKSALSGALGRDPISVLNDLEILNLILRNRSELLIAEEQRCRNLR